MSRSTATAFTPASLVTSSVTAALQCEQVMPATTYVWGASVEGECVVIRWVLGVGDTGRGYLTRRSLQYPRGVLARVFSGSEPEALAVGGGAHAHASVK